jgi:hypothetical protein
MQTGPALDSWSGATCRVGPHREANSIPEFTSEIKLRARPDEIAQRERDPEKERERELEKWREEHKAQLARD